MALKREKIGEIINYVREQNGYVSDYEIMREFGLSEDDMEYVENKPTFRNRLTETEVTNKSSGETLFKKYK